MKTAVSLQLVSPAKKIAFGALFAALCCIGTVIVQIPAPQGGCVACRLREKFEKSLKSPVFRRGRGWTFVGDSFSLHFL